MEVLGIICAAGLGGVMVMGVWVVAWRYCQRATPMKKVSSNENLEEILENAIPSSR